MNKCDQKFYRIVNTVTEVQRNDNKLHSKHFTSAYLNKSTRPWNLLKNSGIFHGAIIWNTYNYLIFWTICWRRYIDVCNKIVFSQLNSIGNSITVFRNHASNCLKIENLPQHLGKGRNKRARNESDRFLCLLPHEIRILLHCLSLLSPEPWKM